MAISEDEFYGMPDLENRGLKVADDHHGAPVDPDTQSRAASAPPSNPRANLSPAASPP